MGERSREWELYLYCSSSQLTLLVRRHPTKLNPNLFGSLLRNRHIEEATPRNLIKKSELRQGAGKLPESWWPSYRPGSTLMTWKTPKIVEVQVGMEINMYACASRK